MILSLSNWWLFRRPRPQPDIDEAPPARVLTRFGIYHRSPQCPNCTMQPVGPVEDE